MAPWEVCLGGDQNCFTMNKMGLADLFRHHSVGNNRNIGISGMNNETRGQNRNNESRRYFPVPSPREEIIPDFFTFRLEHRAGGPTARYREEERILLFRSDRPGSIGKIIYSRSSSNPQKIAGIKNSGNHFTTQTIGDAPKDHRHTFDYNEDELKQMAQAKIHVLDVKEPYRGRDLGGLLFSEAVLSLRDSQDAGHRELSGRSDVLSFRSPPLSSSIRCQVSPF